jgi:hypothetical protein
MTHAISSPFGKVLIEVSKHEQVVRFFPGTFVLAPSCFKKDQLPPGSNSLALAD